jgi:hypothetical protein
LVGRGLTAAVSGGKVRAMAVAAPRSKSERERNRVIRDPTVAVLGIVCVIALGITLYGGYGSPDWTWTGYQDKELWDWLHVLVLPIAFALVATLVRAEELGGWRWVIGLTCLGLFVALTVAGYLIPWDWTGFVGNKVWDWLELVLLPLTLTILAAYRFNIRSVEKRHLGFIIGFVVLIAVLAIGGYTQGWDWTGFEGNTLFDWLQLLFLPVVIPLMVIPFVIALRRESEEEGAERAEI